ncbi:hypothetical protein Tco_1107046 [Tanacetum coccineum]
MGKQGKPLFIFILQTNMAYPLTWIWRIGQILPSFKTSIRHMAPLSPREQRHLFLRYQGLEYTNADIADFEERMVMEHRDDAGVVVFTIRAWGRLFDTRGPLVRELILEFFSTLRFGEVLLDLDALDTIQFQLGGSRRRLRPPPSYTLIRDPVLRLCHQMMAHSIAGRSQAPKKVTVTDLFYLRGMDVGSVNIPYLLARYLRLFTAGRKSGAHISSGQFVARLDRHFRLLTAEILGGLMIIAPKLPIIDMERQPIVAASAPVVTEDAPAADEGDQAVLAPVQAPQQPPPPPPAVARTMPQRLGRLEEEVQGLHRDVGTLRGLVGEIDDRSGEILYMDDVVIPETHRTEDWRGQHLCSTAGPTAARPMIPPILIFLIKPGSKFSTIVHEYVTEACRIFTLNARMGKRDDFKCV